MAEANKIITSIIVGIVLAWAGAAIKSYWERPPTLSAEALTTHYMPPTGQAPANARCLVSVKVTNNTPKPQRQIQVMADHAVAYSIAPPPRTPIVTGSVTKEVAPHLIDVLYPGASRRVFVFTTWICEFNELGHPGMHVFNDEGSATITNIIPPTGWMIYVNEYHYVSMPLIGIGAMLCMLIIINGIIELWRKASGLSAPNTPDPPATTS